MMASEWTFDTLYVIESLSEYRTGRRLADDLSSLCASLQLRCGLCTVHDKRQFVASMYKIRDEASRKDYPIFPVLHFEIHGTEDGNGLHLKSGEIVLWEECVKLWQDINKACTNNLTIVLAVCHGYQAIIEAKNVREICPFFALVGPLKEVKAGQIEEEFPRFYRKLFETGDFDLACRQLSSEYKTFLAEKMFVQGFIHYLLTHSTAKARRLRTENIVSKILGEKPCRFLSPAAAFKYVRQGLKPDARKFEKARTIYLMADHPKNINRFVVTYNEILNEVEKRKNQS